MGLSLEIDGSLSRYDRNFIRNWLRGLIAAGDVGSISGAIHTASNNELRCAGWCVADVENGTLYGYYFPEYPVLNANMILDTIAVELGLSAGFCFDTMTFDGRPIPVTWQFEIAGQLTLLAYRAKHTPLP